jgi:nucleotide-binding universal stress UspA family protein
MYSDILVPTDGGPGMDGAVTRALDLARSLEASVHALYVVDTPRGDGRSRDDDNDAVHEALQEHGHAATIEVQDRAAELDLTAVREIREGTPHRAIQEYAAEHDVDLVVMGARSRADARPRYLGSTTERTLVRAEVPVLAVPPDDSWRLPETRFGAYDRVVIPTDGSDPAGRAADQGLAIAERYGADVRVVYVVDTATHGLAQTPRSIVGLLKDGGRRAVQAVADAARERNLSASTAILRGRPEDAVLQYADGADTDLIAMGTSGRAGVDEHGLGSTTARVVRRSPVPVLGVS